MKKITIPIIAAFIFIMLTIVLVLAAPNPAVNTIVLNSTNGANTTDQNLTVYVTTTNSTKTIYNWFLDGNTVAVLNAPFDVNASKTFGTKDYAGIRNGTILGPTWGATYGVDGKGAYMFSSAWPGDYIEFNDTAGVYNGSQLSVSVWAYKMGSNAYSGFLSTDYPKYFYMGDNGANDVMCGMNISGTRREISSQANAWPAAAWTHIVCTFDGTNMRLYVNGFLNTTSAISGVVLNANSNLEVGQFTGLGGFNGTIDEVYIFNKALSQQQILELYNIRNNVTLSDSLAVGQNWSVEATPTNGTIDGPTVRSNYLWILPFPCYPPESGNWMIDCSQNCTWRTPKNIPGNITIFGSGILTLDSRWYFTSEFPYIYMGSGCKLLIKPRGGFW